jgi:GH25 family lysozyme M1 (1,4-beta-N-acetylmuramidase)
MLKGVDISEHNGMTLQDFQNLVYNGYTFAIVRLGFGSHTVDEDFISNIHNATNSGMRVSVYHFSEALDPWQARVEAQFVKKTLESTGIGCERIWFDMENSNWKEKNGFDYSMENCTEICRAFIDEIKPYNVGIYANYDWFTNRIDWQSLGVPIWVAQYGNSDDIGGLMWQYTDSEWIAGKYYDANISYNDYI